MPCWYYTKDELRSTPSFKDDIDMETEARYRKEGARFIIDSGTKMGLRYDTMATGVIYYHRFYMNHSFREFPRYVTGACCLFLAGKVEETPKKCKDIIKCVKESLEEKYMSTFGQDPKSEVMLMERILLQTIKFDLQVEHPYAYLIKYAKSLKGDKAKLQQMVQMAWTFVNDSLCTTLSLQWEPEIIAIALMYLASRLTKFDVTDWHARRSDHRKWWDLYVEDLPMEIMEDICHQVLDLYSAATSAPPMPVKQESPPVTKTGQKRGRSEAEGTAQQNGPSQPSKMSKTHDRSRSAPVPASKIPVVGPQPSTTVVGRVGPAASSIPSSQPVANYQQQPAAFPTNSATYTGYNNPFLSAQMFSSSFLNRDGQQNIKTLLGGTSQPPPPAARPYQPPPAQYAAPAVAPQQPYAPTTQPPTYPPQQQYPATTQVQQYTTPPPSLQYTAPPPPAQQYQYNTYQPQQYQGQYQQNYSQPPPATTYPPLTMATNAPPVMTQPPPPLPPTNQNYSSRPRMPRAPMKSNLAQVPLTGPRF